MSDELNRRNTEGVMHTIRQLQGRLIEYDLSVQKLLQLVGDLMGRVAKLEAAERDRVVKNMGHGPTE